MRGFWANKSLLITLNANPNRLNGADVGGEAFRLRIAIHAAYSLYLLRTEGECLNACTHRVTVTKFRSISMPAGFRRHLVGKTLRNVYSADT